MTVEADDTLTIEVPDEEIETGADEEVESSPEAQKVATLMGWKPKADWRGDAANWKSAEDFLAEVPAILQNTRAKSRKLEEQQAKIVAQLAKLDGNQRRQMDAEAEQRLEAAIEAGDVAGAKKIMAEARQSATQPDEPPALTAFKARNDWFGVDDEATAYAAALDQTLARGGIADPDAHMRKVEAGVKKRFPELFEDTPRQATRDTPRAPLVARGSRTERRNTGELSAADLTPQQRAAIRQTGCTEASYLRELNKLRQGA